MKKLSLVIAIFFVVCQTAYLPAVYSQTKKDEITAEEKKAANELADRFMQRLDETGDIEPLIKEMFVSDFIQRYVKEEKNKQARENAKSVRMVSVPSLEVDPALLDRASDEEWQQFY